MSKNEKRWAETGFPLIEKRKIELPEVIEERENHWSQGKLLGEVVAYFRKGKLRVVDFYDPDAYYFVIDGKTIYQYKILLCEVCQLEEQKPPFYRHKEYNEVMCSACREVHGVEKDYPTEVKFVWSDYV